MMRWRPAALVLAGTALLAGCSTSGDPSAPSTSGSARSSSGGSTRGASATAPATGGSLPTLPALPTDLAAADPCAHATSALTAASIYLGLAQLGRTAEAQRCVRGDGVSRAATSGLTADDVAGFFVPSGSTAGPVIRFTSATGGNPVTVTTAADAGVYAVTALARG